VTPDPRVARDTGTDLLPEALQRSKAAVYLVFIAAGVCGASWASRLPQVRDELGLTPAVLGFALLALAVGSLVSLPSAGLVVHRLGSARTIVVMAVVVALGLATAGVGVRVGLVVVLVGLFLLGYGAGTWDVAMNVEGAAVEQELARPIMSRFHAGFSVGTVLGALVGAAMIALGVSVTVHLALISVLVVAVVPLTTRAFLPAGDTDQGDDAPRENPLRSWREPRTLLIGLFVLTMAFAEGTANDWLGIAAIDGHGASATAASLAFGSFLVAMTLGRWFGPQVIDRLGRVRALRVSAAIAFAGLVLVVLGPSLAVAFGGALLWGLGTALGFPVGMSAAADDPRRAAGRVSVVATIGYVAFLAGPPLVGVLGNQAGVLRALWVTAAIVAVGFLLAGVTRPLSTDGRT
jgi:fucose permease